MKVVHLCTQDTGGAGIACLRLHQALKSEGVDSHMLVVNKTQVNDDVEALSASISPAIFGRLFRRAAKSLTLMKNSGFYTTPLPENPDIFSDDRTGLRISEHHLIAEADVIHLHWVAGMVDYLDLFPNIAGKKIVWTLHDMNPFTGGCHYCRGCRRYESGCGRCPQLASAIQDDLSKKIFLRKQKAYEDVKINVVTPSRWLAECVRDSSLMGGFPQTVIPNGVPTDVYCDRGRSVYRRELGLDEDDIVVLFGAAYRVWRKGFNQLIQALDGLRNGLDRHVAFVTVGCDYDLSSLAGGAVKVGHLGRLAAADMPAAYSMADFFTIPSLEDNLPNMVLESMSCGTPVVGFAAGGVPDMVREGETGLLANVGDVTQLSEKIKWMIEHDEDRKAMGANARKVVEKEYTLKRQAKAYLSLYERL